MRWSAGRLATRRMQPTYQLQQQYITVVPTSRKSKYLWCYAARCSFLWVYLKSYLDKIYIHTLLFHGPLLSMFPCVRFYCRHPAPVRHTTTVRVAQLLFCCRSELGNTRIIMVVQRCFPVKSIPYYWHHPSALPSVSLPANTSQKPVIPSFRSKKYFKKTLRWGTARDCVSFGGNTILLYYSTTIFNIVNSISSYCCIP